MGRNSAEVEGTSASSTDLQEIVAKRGGTRATDGPFFELLDAAEAAGRRADELQKRAWASEEAAQEAERRAAQAERAMEDLRDERDQLLAETATMARGWLFGIASDPTFVAIVGDARSLADVLSEDGHHFGAGAATAIAEALEQLFKAEKTS